jgi:hypothetical protein
MVHGDSKGRYKLSHLITMEIVVVSNCMGAFCKMPMPTVQWK